MNLNEKRTFWLAVRNKNTLNADSVKKFWLRRLYGMFRICGGAQWRREFIIKYLHIMFIKGNPIFKKSYPIFKRGYHMFKHCYYIFKQCYPMFKT